MTKIVVGLESMKLEKNARPFLSINTILPNICIFTIQKYDESIVNTSQNCPQIIKRKVAHTMMK